MANLLIVDDEAGYRDVLKVIFNSEGYTVQTAENGSRALEKIKSDKFDVVISDVRMPDMDGISLLEAVRNIYPDIGVVLMTAFGTIDTAREAFKLGADDFIQKPFNNEELTLIVRRAIEKQSIVRENRAFRLAQRSQGSIENIIGSSAAMQEVFNTVRMVAKEASTVLITGESGTGKELVARAIHDLSDRSDKPFIPLNCGAMPEHLLEAELFGFIKGTFTGADKNRTGLFEAADGGTIFLDEIGDMPFQMQAKVLRVLQDHHIRPLGATAEIPIDTRVIAATNRDIGQMIEDGSFREDLYYRLSVIPLNLPPLRERRDDIPELADHFIEKFTKRSGKKVGISQKALAALIERPWKGNVRELEHTIERAFALTAEGEEIQPQHCAEQHSNGKAAHFNLPMSGMHLPSFMNDLEKQMVEEAMRKMDGNQTRAAEMLGIAVHAYRHLLSKHHIHNGNGKC